MQQTVKGISILNCHAEPAGKNAGFCIMRGYSPLANPFKVKPWGPYERGESIPHYEAWLREKLFVERDPVICRAMGDLYLHWQRTGELRLVCCCFPQDCHARIVREILIEKSPNP